MSNTNIIFCKNHSNRKAYRFCDICKEFICNSCAFNEKHITHLQNIKSFKEILKTFFPNINYQNISHLSKYIELFHFILNYNSSFMPFDLNEIMDQINDKFDEYINQLIELKIKFKILISEKFGILQSLYAEQEKKIIETQNKLLYILNNEDVEYFEKMNTNLEKIRMNKNEKKMLGFIEEYNKLLRKSFDDDLDFENKYNLFMAQKLVVKSNKYIKENILDKIIKNFFDDAIKNIDTLYQKINSQNNEDIESIKKNFEYISENNIDEEEKKYGKPNTNLKFNPNINIKNNINNKEENTPKEKEKEKEKDKEVKPKINQVSAIAQEIEKKLQEERNNKIEQKNISIPDKKEKEKEKRYPNNEILNLEFEPPEIEAGQFTKEELAEMDIDDDYENEFLKIEEDGDDGLLLAEIVDGNCSDNASVNSEQFYVDNIDDKLNIQYYEGVKFEGEGVGEGLNDEAIVVDGNEEENKEEGKKEDEIKKDEIKKEEAKQEEEPKEETGKKSNNIEEIKKQLMSNFNKANNLIKPPLKPIKQTQAQTKKQDKDLNIAEFIEEKTEQEEAKLKEKNKIPPKEEKKNEIKEETDKKLKELCQLAKAGKRNSFEFQEAFNQLAWESRGKIELMAVDQKNGSLKIYNIYTEKFEEIKVDFKIPMHLSYINIPPYLYISGGKQSGKDLTSVRRIIRTGQNSVKCEELAQLSQGRNSHCTVYVKNVNCLFFISGSRIKSVEKFNFNKNKMESFPGLKISREKCCACLLNEKYLYVFFGFDRTKNKFETSIEKIYIHDAMSWEMINLSGNLNIFKKQSFACIPIVRDSQKGVIITGGINSLRNESKETVHINIEKNKAEVFSPLPTNSSFTNSYFVYFDKYALTNEIFNISNEYNVIKYNLDKNEFV